MSIRTSMRDAAPTLAEIFGATNSANRPSPTTGGPSKTINTPQPISPTPKTPKKALSVSPKPPKKTRDIQTTPQQLHDIKQKQPTPTIDITPKTKKSHHKCSNCGKLPSEHAKPRLGIPAKAGACERTDEAVRRDKMPRNTRAERLARARFFFGIQ